MYVRKSTSLTAGVSALCITASLVAPASPAAAAVLPATAHRTVSVVDQPYALTASSQQIIQDLLVVAGIPFQNIYTTVNALGGLTVFVTNTNKALGAIPTGQWDKIPGYLQAAANDEIAAINKIIALPQTLSDYNTTAIKNLLASLSGASPTPAAGSTAIAAAAAPAAAAAAATATAATTAASPEDILTDLLAVAGIPFQNLYTTVNALGGLTVFVTNTNKALGAIPTGQWDTIPGYLQAAANDEIAAINKIIALPQTLSDYNTTAIKNLLANFTPAAPVTSTVVQSAQKLALPAAASAVDRVTPTALGETTASDETVAKDEKAPSETDPDTASTEKPSEKPEPKDAGAAEEAAKPDKRAYGKHARQDGATESNTSAAAGTSAGASAPGRHRKAEAKSAKASASSAGKSSAGAN